MNDRDCENCVHHTGGSCSVWECSYEPIEDDLISRKAAIDEVNDITKWYRKTYHETRPTTIAIIDALKQLPSAQPERKTGKWLCSDDLYETAVCSCCGWDTAEPWQHIKSWFEFCPHCGADMRG